MINLPDSLVLTFYAAFFAVLFLQSGLDKLTDFKGNLSWLEPHFSKTFFGKQIRFFLVLLTLMEISSGLLNLAALLGIFYGNFSIFLFAQLLTGFTLLLLFAGQRIAKDYAGASTIAVYFGVWLLGFVLVG